MISSIFFNGNITSLPVNLIWVLRLVIAMLCGGLIGYERTRQLKSAGIRTHVIVAAGSALIMLVSKYGFYDILATHNIALDPSRIAAQIVSGIGFLGAGTILVGQAGVSGLTTAAGIWTTSAIGMAEGAGLYYIGIITTVLVLFIQFVVREDFLWNLMFRKVRLRFQLIVKNQPGTISEIRKVLLAHHLTNLRMQIDSANRQSMTLHIKGAIDHKLDVNYITEVLSQNKLVTKIIYTRDPNQH